MVLPLVKTELAPSHCRLRAASNRSLHCLIALVSIAVFLTSCAPVVGNNQSTLTEWITLRSSVTLGQTFVANYDGLSGIQLFLSPQSPGAGKINIHVRADAQSTTDIVVSSLSIDKVKSPGFYSIFFDPQNVSKRKYYYIFIGIKGEGSVQVGSAGGETYLDGARYLNSTAQDGQLTFKLMYSVRRLGVGLLREFTNWILVLLAGAFLYLIPGWGLLRVLWPGWEARSDGTSLTWLEKLGLSAGVSLVIYPILMLWTSLVGLRLGPIYAWLPPFAGIAILFWFNREKLFRRTHSNENYAPSISARRRLIQLPTHWFFPSLSSVLFVVIAVLLIFTRFWAIRTLDAPMWGDSYQHTVIAQRIVEHNGLFQSWQPYADLQTFTYHFGFHSNAAVFHWVTGLGMPRAVLWVGQLFNILTILSLYPLAMKVCRNRWSGVTALVIGGFLAPVPMTYTNWGRYTQLAGQIVLVTVIYVLWSLAEQATAGEKATVFTQNHHSDNLIPKKSAIPGYLSIILAAMLMGGLALTHFRVLLFALVFLTAIIISSVLSRMTRREWKRLALTIIWIGIGGGIIFLPWFINSFAGTILRNFTNQLTTPASAVPVEMQSYNTVGILSQYLPVGLWLLFPLAAAWGLWKQHKGIRLICFWSFLMFLVANPAWLRLPGTGAINNFAIFIAIYIPASLLIGGAVGLFGEEYLSGEWRADLSLKLADGWKANLLRLGVVGIRKNSRIIKWANGMIAMVLIGVSLVGIPQRLTDLHPERYALLTHPDLRAASWIKDHLNPNASLLVNSFFAYGGTLVVGSDGGWWLPLLTKRRTNLPPLNYGTEKGFQSDYKKQVNELPKAIAEKGLVDTEVLDMLRERKVTHIYIGQRQGRVNYGGPVIFDPAQLSADSNFKVVYHQDRVWIFEVGQTP